MPKNAHVEMEQTVTTVADGHYADKQLNCPSSVIAFSHRARFTTAVALAGRNPEGRLLDYGAGDGTFLAMVAGHFASCVGADIAPEQVDDCTRRFHGVPNVTFCEISALQGAAHDAAYDVVTCMEVMEHCPPEALQTVVSDLRRLVTPNGRVIVSVPIETGPAFILKYVVRTVAGWRRLSDYRHYERYPVRDALRMIFATKQTQVVRPLYGEVPAQFHSHYGFNWHAVERRLEDLFVIEQRMVSPFTVLGGACSSQAWMICRPRP